jgi:hypothetical protein
MRALVGGELDVAARLAEEARAMGRRSGEPDAELVFLGQTLAIGFDGPTERDRQLAEAWCRDLDEQHPDEANLLLGVHTFLLCLLVETGCEEEARAELSRFQRHGLGRIARNYLWPQIITGVAGAVARYGPAADAATQYEMLLPHASTCAQDAGAVIFHGSFSLSLWVSWPPPCAAGRLRIATSGRRSPFTNGWVQRPTWSERVSSG